jgi:hypothetical protein
VVPHRRQSWRQVVSPFGRKLRRRAQLAPALSEVLELGHVVFLEGIPQTVQSLVTHEAADIGLRDDWDQGLDGTVHR